jgi:hypothetical protein
LRGNPLIQSFQKPLDYQIFLIATTSKKEIAFKSDWLKLYGLQITAQYVNTAEVLNVQCGFLEFGRDEVDSEERQRKNQRISSFQEALASR